MISKVLYQQFCMDLYVIVFRCLNFCDKKINLRKHGAPFFFFMFQRIIVIYGVGFTGRINNKSVVTYSKMTVVSKLLVLA